ncbi:hypothetical protein RND81_04G038700 [Saponaria officinalis]|uniref:Retrovirus-related Pol polyprotein from transposon TNT 1-94-like beta-barrel domain-containing protein n=1 Tax=Saponaria officinalis TaxID=3572 RepID=A0AAW1LG58_SAPOF
MPHKVVHNLKPQFTEESSTSEIVKLDNKSAKDNRTVRGVMSNLITNLFAKGIWDALKTNHGSDVFGKPIMEQINDYENLVSEILGEGMVLCEFMQANAFIEKLRSPGWDKYKKYLRHKKKDIKLQELIGHIKIEDAIRSQDLVRANATNTIKANVVEYRNTGTNKRSYNQYNKPQANVVEGSSEGDDIIVAMVSKINLVGNLVEWIVDTRATHVDEKEVVYVGNSNEVSVLDIGKVHLKLTFGKVLTLDNVLYVPDMRRNLISGALLYKVGLKLIFESDKLVMSKNGQFVGKGFRNDGLFFLTLK